ncbi:CopG family ribbon-helix-helix protein [Candidatus Korobacter versatilis]|nr:ribbon-helix-helix protein, CopG family [Candidatus Koribacter versatilis]
MSECGAMVENSDLLWRAVEKEDQIMESAVVIQINTHYDVCIMANSEKTISFRAQSAQIDALDSLASAQSRSRSYVINEAIANYIALHEYQDELVREGLEDMRKGRTITNDELLKRIQKTGRAGR